MASTKTLTGQKWWKDTARDLVDAPVCDVAVRPNRRTTISRRRSLTGRRRAVALTVDKFDFDEHTDTDAGRWLLVQQAALLDVAKPRLAGWGKGIQDGLIVTAAVAAFLAVSLSGPPQMFAVVAAAITAAGGWWLWRERRRDLVGDMIRADLTATAACGTDAAVTALTSRPELFRSKWHTLNESRNPLSDSNRAARLRDHT